MTSDEVARLIDELLDGPTRDTASIDVYAVAALTFDTNVDEITSAVCDQVSSGAYETAHGRDRLGRFAERLVANEATPPAVMVCLIERMLDGDNTGMNFAGVVGGCVDHTNADADVIAATIERTNDRNMAALWMRITEHPELSWDTYIEMCARTEHPRTAELLVRRRRGTVRLPPLTPP
jgi:hypothetical protein